MKIVIIYIIGCIALITSNACAGNAKSEEKQKPNDVLVKEKSIKLEAKLFLNLPETFNSPASGDIDKEGNVYFTSPNFHNEVFIKAGEMTEPATPTIGKIDKDNQFSTWYTFKPEDMEKTSGKVVPFGLMFGPDGHAYVGDMQLWAGGTSRILRIIVKKGKAIGTETVLVGTAFINGLAWKGDELFIADTVLGETADGKQISGVYKVNISELNADKPLYIKKYVDEKNHDSHLFETFISNASLKFGANGLAFDGVGNMYTGIMEEGSVHKTTMDANNNKIETILFVDGMIATDGMKWDARTNKLYITDVFANAVYSIDMKGKLELIVKNGNTTGINGELDAPSEVIVRGKDVIVMNFDAAFGVPSMVNTIPDKPCTLSTIKLK